MYIDCLHPSAFPTSLSYVQICICVLIQFLKTDSAIILRLGLLKCETIE